MGKIYESAHRVIIWLGNCSSEIAAGVPGLPSSVGLDAPK